MPVNIQNIIIGACSSFKCDTTDVGGTDGGVSINPRDTFKDIQVDQIIGVVKKTRTNRVVQIVTTMKESTLENLKLAFNLNSTITTDGTSGDKTLGIGVDTSTTEHTLQFVGPGPDGFTRTFNVNRAIGYASGNYQIRKDQESVVQVTFDCLPDMSKTAGQEYGTIVESDGV
ncbi:hypothetical protein ACFP7A_01205 [Sporolactobacillus kofuensis]|uniref:Phage tail protein n=1 Tax=Sporolactobacillus kofuensis TaxID=269672 RepID=A0ABW1WDF9_9BACL|nr:hypothetical protein [Sporolactobacillus kofuensis]MCO7177015.1 hypothetical protein [Sporolactobacillus kofuensis]